MTDLVCVHKTSENYNRKIIKYSLYIAIHEQHKRDIVGKWNKMKEKKWSMNKKKYVTLQKIYIILQKIALAFNK